MAKNSAIIVTYAALAVALLYILEQVTPVSYAVKTGVKILLFAALPILYSRRVLGEHYLFGSKVVLSGKALLHAVAVGLAAFLAIFAAYFFLSPSIDFASIIRELHDKLGITAANFVVVGLYVAIGNSFIEEYFFRKHLFLNLYRSTNRIAAYCISALLFALYHIAIIETWFSLPLMALALAGLFGVGLAFNYLNRKAGHFLNSWLAHMLADLALFLIGLRMFALL